MDILTFLPRDAGRNGAQTPVVRDRTEQSFPAPLQRHGGGFHLLEALQFPQPLPCPQVEFLGGQGQIALAQAEFLLGQHLRKEMLAGALQQRRLVHHHHRVLRQYLVQP